MSTSRTISARTPIAAIPIAAIPSDATLGEAAAAYQAAIDAWDAALVSIRTEAGC